MHVLTDIRQLATCPPDSSDAGLVNDAALVWDDGAVVWAGREVDLPETYRSTRSVSAEGRLVVPGLIDCHTHLAFGGDRAGEFVERLKGTPYLEIARRGGGILNTVRHTRAASQEHLLKLAEARLSGMLRQGVTTVEAKTGYGLNVADEIKTLEVYRQLEADAPQRMVTTLLAAHAVPPEFADDRSGYLRLITDEILPRAAELATFVDVFVEQGAFTPDEARAVFEAGRRHGLVPKLHADQLSDTRGAELAVEVGAASADHLECISDDGIEALASSNTVAVSLPTATLVLGQEPLPARRLLDAGAMVAVATDFNPGSAPSPSLPLALWLACTRQRMTPEEVLRGATTVAARALQLDGIGSLLPGFAADVAVLDAPTLDAWLYAFSPADALRTVIAGETVWVRKQE